MLCFIETSNPLIGRLIKKLTENKILIKISSMVTFLEMLQKQVFSDKKMKAVDFMHHYVTYHKI